MINYILLFKITIFYLNIFSNLIYSCDFKAEFINHHYSSHMIPQETFVIIWFAAKKKIYIIMLKTAE